jgi:hypothetical protein
MKTILPILFIISLFISCVDKSDKISEEIVIPDYEHNYNVVIRTKFTYDGKFKNIVIVRVETDSNVYYVPKGYNKDDIKNVKEYFNIYPNCIWYRVKHNDFIEPVNDIAKYINNFYNNLMTQINITQRI